MSIGKLFGNGRAEADQRMLDLAFVQTPNYLALVRTQEFHFVVGRRGTGKSALFRAVHKHYAEAERVWVTAEVPREEDSFSLQAELERRDCTDYNTVRAVSRQIWLTYILGLAARDVVEHYKAHKVEDLEWLKGTVDLILSLRHRAGAYAYACEVLKRCDAHAPPKALAGAIAGIMSTSRLERCVFDALRELGFRSVLLLDSLDEGWEPRPLHTAILGGLAKAVADLKEAQSSVHVVAFVRDNMFRALAELDPDFSRHVEGSDMRLFWDENALLQLVTERLRASLAISKENDIKVWNRFAHRELKDRAGFQECLKSTLYRPRDLLNLLNCTHQIARRNGREQIVPEDLSGAAQTISIERLRDLYKEYDAVLPGLRMFAELFREQPSTQSGAAVVGLLADALASETYTSPGSRDFAILNSPRAVFSALYAVGFLGVQDKLSGGFRFCHDGSINEPTDLDDSVRVAIHPCFWKALEVQYHDEDLTVLTEINDEYSEGTIAAAKDLRMKQIGEVLGTLPRLRHGKEDAPDFERWVERVVRLLFAGDLSEVERTPNGDATLRRDVVARNNAQTGFWRRVLEDYKARQVVFEVKNYPDLKPEDFNQCLAYGGATYGNITFLVYRTKSEGASDNERTHIQARWQLQRHLIFLLPDSVLARCVAKQRSKDKGDQWERTMGKRLDTHERNYLSIRAGRKG